MKLGVERTFYDGVVFDEADNGVPYRTCSVCIIDEETGWVVVARGSSTLIRIDPLPAHRIDPVTT